MLSLADHEVDGFLDAASPSVDRLDPWTTDLPLLHPRYRAVWVPRPGDTSGEYVDAIGQALDDV